MTPVPGVAALPAGLVARQSLEYQQAHLYQDHTHDLGGFLVVLVILSAFAMFMRVWCRLRLKEGLLRDDYAYLTGSTLAIGSFIVMLLYAFDAGLGKHWAALTPEQRVLFPKLNYAYNIINVMAYPLIKISFLLLYIRIFHVLPTFCRIVWGGITVLACVLIANTLISIFSCVPVQGFFDTSVPAKCIDEVAYYYWTAVINCVSDLFILIVPLPVIWRRNLQHKWAVTILFMIGGLTFVLSILRIVYYLDYTTDDTSYSFLKSGYASPAEVGLAVIATSAPTWLPLWRPTAYKVQQFYHNHLRSPGRSSRNSADAGTLRATSASEAATPLEMSRPTSNLYSKHDMIKTASRERGNGTVISDRSFTDNREHE